MQLTSGVRGCPRLLLESAAAAMRSLQYVPPPAADGFSLYVSFRSIPFCC
jgi:hypothetical protein